MREGPSRADRTSAVVTTVTARRAVRPAVWWGLLFGALIANEALTYRSTFPTMASRREFAATFGTNQALAAIVGPGHRLSTVDGVVAWRVFGLMIIVGAIWGLLAATNLTRGEEDAGRWELLLAGRTSRRRAAWQALLGLGAGWSVLWALTAVATTLAGSSDTVGFSVGESLFYATATTASAALFLAVGALASQLTSTRRQARGLATAAFAACYLVRLVADGRDGLGWLRWASPLGWIENARPLTDPQPAALALVAVLTGVLAATCVAVAGWRDVGAGALERQREVETAIEARGRPGSPLGLAWHLERWVVLAWIAAIGGLGVIFGVVAGAADEAHFASTVGETVAQLGGQGAGAQAWIGYLFLYVAAILAFAAGAQIASLRNEEAAGHLDHLLARSASRRAWLAGRLAMAVCLVLGSSVTAALGGWAGLHRDATGLDAMLRAGINISVPGLFVLGVGTLLYGLVPRFAAPALYTLVLWSFVVEIFGTGLTDNHWLLDTALLTHLGPVPASPLQWQDITWLCVIAIVAAGLGAVAFDRRDLSGA
ncbi:ABC transporter membrane-spanning protein [Nocardioides panacihumi]|uniref:ABC transporter membrane-spanning protein n=1 Tax=Nocardioides panacihumi TaxID=400774 RepID=A0ABN2RYZ8_9ACTN